MRNSHQHSWIRLRELTILSRRNPLEIETRVAFDARNKLLQIYRALVAFFAGTDRHRLRLNFLLPNHEHIRDLFQLGVPYFRAYLVVTNVELDSQRFRE